ncbi:MAG: methylmalonyl-CoA mutase family protein [Candidatus Latescibacterota bacterium]|nr:MAG: methylmalonyl-CoA mutase family protein [Candidatus Latescibacterota bacterium]
MNPKLKAALKEKRKEYLDKTKKSPQLDMDFTTVSSEPVDILYTPEDVEDIDYMADIGFPGEYPYTRGVHPNMYRGKMWTMRLFSGFGSAKDTNERYHYLLKGGQTGLSVAFDLPTLYGVDSDNPRAVGEVGKCGVAIDSIRDMETLFRGIDLGKITVSMTINGPAVIVFALFAANAQNQGVPLEKLGGTTQNDILKEYIAQKSFIFPPEPSMRLIADKMEFCTKNVPLWNTISISGYHIREAGSTAVQELAFTLADGFAYVEAGIEAGLDIDEFAPRLSFFFNSHLDFFEEICKFRAARRIWARRMREKYGAKNARSWLMRFHTQTAGCSLTAQQPENNIVRTAYQGLAAVLGGTQSLHTNSMDETLALPTAKAARIALRTQQIIAYETGVINTVDPLAGSYFVEAQTKKMEEQAEEYFRQIDELGGVIKAIEAGFFAREIGRAAYEYQKAVERERKVIVGVNDFLEGNDDDEIPTLYIDEKVERDQVAELKRLREERDNGAVSQKLETLRKAAEGTENVLPHLLDCAKAGATKGEMTDVFKGVFGEYREPAYF